MSEPTSTSTTSTPAPSPGTNRRDWAVLALLLAAFALSRGLVFPFAENLYGDAVVRSELAERWVQEPKLLRSFQDGAYQFGPLHLYLMGAALEAWPSREHATRLVSLLMSLLLVIPVYRIGRRLFSREAALVTGLAMAAWGLHIQVSTTAASEAVFLTLFFFALDFLTLGMEQGRLGPIVLSALFVNLFCATRYDGWIYCLLFGLVLAFSGKDRIAAFTRTIVFLGLCAPFPLWWTQQSEKASGDAFFALHYIDQFHARWASESIAWMGQAGFRLSSLFFWPGTLLLTCSLLVGVFAIAGIARAFVKHERRALAVLALLPAAYFSFRGAVLGNFAPLARFTMVQLALSLFYVKDGFDLLCGRLSRNARLAVGALTVLIALGTTLGIGAATAWKEGKVADALRPVAPISTLPADQMSAARLLKQQVGAAESVVIDESPDYVDINVAFFTGLPEERLVRRRWENFEKQLHLNPDATWLFLARGGAFESKDGLKLGDPRVSWRGHDYEKIAAPSEKLFVYRRL